MTKRQLIDRILSINETAEPGFLAQFQRRDLDDYLAQLTGARMPEGSEPENPTAPGEGPSPGLSSFSFSQLAGR